MRVWLGGLVIVLILPCLAGCKKLSTGAREYFSERYSCPEDRVTVKERPDLNGGRARLASSPPSDVAKDPERLAMWKKQQEEKRNAIKRSCDGFEVEGCGQKVEVCCSYPDQKGRAGRAGRVSCSEL